MVIIEDGKTFKKPPSTVREGKVGCGTEARRGIWSAVQKGALEGSICFEPDS
ncbi:hypothetical protein HPP92_016494 [Vanilla planifolia]|uniref:Uncharacterized protein n=1 Tax=Vanilla planifolia TaxID=51239 RepID=A0A835UNI2_VANPL|nr:hypothetical protein HPP92_016494 [Vanilla planifolia]